jgi:predicted secreted protein
MSVGIGMIGREVTVTVGGATLKGINSKGISLSNEALDTTDDQSSGYQEFLATSGLKTAEFTISGILKNLELMDTYAGTSQILAVVKTYPDGSTLSFDAYMEGLNQTGESNGLYTFDATFKSSGTITWVAGT